MYKLNALNPDGTIKFEQVFGNYVHMKQKQEEFIKEGLMTVITPMTLEQHLAHSEEILKKVTGLTIETLLN